MAAREAANRDVRGLGLCFTVLPGCLLQWEMVVSLTSLAVQWGCTHVRPGLSDPCCLCRDAASRYTRKFCGGVYFTVDLWAARLCILCTASWHTACKVGSQTRAHAWEHRITRFGKQELRRWGQVFA